MTTGIDATRKALPTKLAAEIRVKDDHCPALVLGSRWNV